MTRLRLPLILVILAHLVAPIGATAETLPKDLLCAKQGVWTIRLSNTLDGCRTNERSLGAKAIITPRTPVTGIHPKLEVRFKAARAAASLAGVNLYIASGYRTQARQQYLFEEAIKKYGSETEAARWVLPPYLSHHPLGLAIDVNYPNDPKGAKWLERNGSRFGLCRIFDNEWWHFEAPIAPGGICPPRMKDASELMKKE